MRLAPELAPTAKPVVTGPRDAALRAARTCYDHLAGRLGVALADALVRAGHVELESDAGIVTPSGLVLLERIGIDADTLASGGAAKSRRVLCRPCLDWSERRPHLAGGLGAALLTRSLELGWVARVRDTRAIAVTPRGREGYAAAFGIDIAALAASAASRPAA